VYTLFPPPPPPLLGRTCSTFLFYSFVENKALQDKKEELSILLVWNEDSCTGRFFVFCCFHTCVSYKPKWFISTSPLYYFLVPLHSDLSQFKITVFAPLQWAHQIKFLVSFPFPIPPMPGLSLVCDPYPIILLHLF
jgi:hypothetical protein